MRPVMALLDFLNPEKIIKSMGVWATLGLFAIIFAESGLLIGFFLPGDSLLFTAGLLSSQPNSHLNFPVIVVGCTLAAIIGDQVGYMFGKKVGPSVFKRPDSRLFKQEYVDKSSHFFELHGPKTIILARFVPIVRTFVPVLAGVGKMHYRTFLIYNIVGGVLWGAGVTTLGYLLGKTIPAGTAEKYLLAIIGVIVIISLIPPFLEWRKHKRAKARSGSGERT